MNAVLVSIGDELVLGETVDTNAAWLSAHLAECGIMTTYHEVVPDERKAISRAITTAASEADLVIASGGLGPTPDDLTRSVFAEITGMPLVLHRPSLCQIKNRFLMRKIPMTKSCRIQAMVPAGADIIENTCGTAPGMRIRFHNVFVFAVPGVPAEMKAMFLRSIMPELKKMRSCGSKYDGFISIASMNTFGCGESSLAEKLGPLMNRERNPKVGTTVSGGIVSVRVRSDFEDDKTSQRELQKTCRMIKRRLGTFVFGEEHDTLQDALGQLLSQSGRTVVTAESCTAGLAGKLLTDPPGSSAWYLGGWIAYSNVLKNKLLCVPWPILKRHGAVSRQTAERMARNAIRKSHADYSIAITGIAGPDGAMPDKPVGTVWIAIGKKQGSRLKVFSECFFFAGDREQVRDRTAKTAINLLRLDLLNDLDKACVNANRRKRRNEK